jgi:tyrosine-protein phosphatase SIW14
VSRRSFIALFFLVITGFAVFLACRNRNVTAVQAGTSQEFRAGDSQLPPLADNSAQVIATLPYFHRLDATYMRGSTPAKGGIETLKRLGVKTVVDLRSTYDHTDDIGVATERSGMVYYWLPTSVWDPPTDAKAQEFVSVVADESKGPFYVFCADGLNRVGEMSAIYRVAKSKWTVDQAIKEIDDFGFNPYYWNLRSYVYTYARIHYPKSLPPQARSLSSTEVSK